MMMNPPITMQKLTFYFLPIVYANSMSQNVYWRANSPNELVPLSANDPRIDSVLSGGLEQIIKIAKDKTMEIKGQFCSDAPIALCNQGFFMGRQYVWLVLTARKYNSTRMMRTTSITLRGLRSFSFGEET